MLGKIDFSYTGEHKEDERREKIIEILSQGVYAYLKKKGLLKDKPGRSKKIKLLLDKTKEMSHNEGTCTSFDGETGDIDSA